MSMELSDSRPRTAHKHTLRSNPRAHARSWVRAMLFGAQERCPSCGEGDIYQEGGGMKVVNYCPHCEEELYHHRASGMTPWISAFLAAHVVIITAFIVEWLTNLPLLWVAIPALVSMCLLTALLLPRVKGALVGLQWATRMHGFQYAAMCKPRHPHPRGTH